MAVALAALDAVVHVEGVHGTRSIPLVDLHRLPAEEPQRDTVLARDELVTAVECPPLPYARNSRYVKVRERASFAFALISVAIAVDLDVDDNTVRDVRLALGGVAHKPWRATRAEALLRGAPATEQSFETAAQAELLEARPLRDNAYKLPLARNLIVRTLLELTQAT
jgi:xanthine dehydrogenase YagS FAD-binding subunit